MKSTLNRAAIILLAAMTVSLSGCATTSVNEAMEMARAAQADAASARDAASSAASAVAAAERAAAEAMRAAKAAQSAADAANNCCAVNSEKIDRMFRESMRK